MTKLLKNKTFLFTCLYFVVRASSYFFPPDTPLHPASLVNTLISALILFSVAYLLYKKNIWGWYIILAEIILGGSGGFFQIFSISLRNLLLITSISIFTYQNFNFKKINLFKNPNLFLIAIAILGVTIGYFNKHNIKLIYADFIPYLYFLYYFPLKKLLLSDEFRLVLKNLVFAWVMGNFIFILFSFIGFSTNIFELQGNFYHWYRDVAMGKITDVGTGFFRMTLDEHLSLVPLVLVFLYQIINRKKEYLIPITLLLVVLSINLTRIYWLALAIGILFLFSKNNWRAWLKTSVYTFLILISSFTFLHFLSTGTLGLEILGLRTKSLISPQSEDSSLTRMLILPKALEIIKNNPILGEGLGSTVTVYSPVFEKEITTPQFDWGYLEIMAELGLVGLIFWVYLIYIIIYIIIYIKNYSLLPSLVALIVINITSPALFHVWGIIILTFILTNLKNKYDIKTTKTLS